MSKQVRTDDGETVPVISVADLKRFIIWLAGGTITVLVILAKVHVGNVEAEQRDIRVQMQAVRATDSLRALAIQQQVAAFKSTLDSVKIVTNYIATSVDELRGRPTRRAATRPENAAERNPLQPTVVP